MKTSEFIKKLEEIAEELGDFEVEHDKEMGQVWLENECGEAVTSIVTSGMYGINVYTEFYDWVSDEIRQEIFDIAVEYARTLLEDREKLYHIKLSGISKSECFVNYKTEDDRCLIHDKSEMNGYVTRFTKSEAERFLKRLRFELVEVEDDN